MGDNLPVERSSEDEARARGANLPAPIQPVPALAPAQAFFDEEEEPQADPRRILATVLRYKWAVAGCGALGLGVGLVLAKLRAPEYEAQATIWVELGGGPRGPIQEGPVVLNTNWVDLLRSFTVLDTVVKQQRLFLAPAKGTDTAALRTFDIATRFSPGEYELKVTGREFTLSSTIAGVIQHGTIGDSIGPALGFVWVPPPGTLVSGSKVAFRVMPPRQAALDVNERLDAKIPLQAGNFMRLTLKGTNPALTAATLNGIAEQFVNVAADLKRRKLRELSQILDAQLQQSVGELRSAESALEHFRVNTITEPGELQAPPVTSGLQMTQTPALQSYFQMKLESDQARRDREAIQRVLSQPPDSGITAVTLEAIPSVEANADLKNALTDLTNREADLRAWRVRYTEENPMVQQRLRDIRALQRQSIPALLRALLAELETRQGTLDQRIGAASRDLQQIPRRSIEEARLTRDRDIASTLYANLQQRYSEARLGEASSVPDVRILDPAVTPDRPLKNITMMIILGGLAGGLGVGIALALLLDRFDRRLRYPDQVTRDLGLTILGAVPRATQGNGAGLKGTDAAMVVEALRTIRLNIVNAYGTAGPLVTTITSPGSGDGKSFVSSNLALAFGDAGHRTLLIDGDIRRGTLHRVLSASRKPGLLDYLGGQAKLDQVVQTTRVQSVDFIGCGTRKMGGPELLASPMMSQLLISLRAKYGVIIIDSAPLGAGVDPLVLGSLTGSLLLVLRTGVTDRELALAKMGDLSRLPIRVLGAVLNDVKPQGVYKYYSYLPGYTSDDEAEAERSDVSAKKLPAGKS